MLFTRQAAEANARATAAEGQFNALKAALVDGGHFALTGGVDGKFSLSLTDAGKTHFAAELTELQAQLADANASVQSLVTEKTALEAKLSAAASSERTRIAAALESDGLFKLAFDAEGRPALALAAADGLFALAPGDNGKLALALTAAGETRFVNDKAARVLAGAGHQPLSLSVDTPAPGSAPAANGEGRTNSTWARDFSKR